MTQISTTLEHRVLLPEGSQAHKHPTMIMLHGRGTDEEDLISLAQQYDHRLLVLSVRAPFPYQYGVGYTWYDVGSIGTPDPVKFPLSYGKLLQFVEDVVQGYPVDPACVYLFGFSMGSVMAFALSLTRPEFFRAVIANSGYVPEGTNLWFRWQDLGNIDFFIAHGRQDPVIPIELARRGRQLLDSSNARVTYREYDMGHQISEASLRDSAAFIEALIAK
jgi:phospholipase/carboxylesterase